MKRLILFLPLVSAVAVSVMLLFKPPAIDPILKTPPIESASTVMLTQGGRKEMWQRREGVKDRTLFKFGSSVIFSKKGVLVQELSKLTGQIPSDSSSGRPQLCEILAPIGICSLNAGKIDLPKAHLVVYEPKGNNLPYLSYRPQLIADGACSELSIKLRDGPRVESNRMRATLYSAP